MEKYVWQPKDGITTTLEIDGEKISVNGTLKSENVDWDEVRTKELDKRMFEGTPETVRQQELKNAILNAIEAGLDDFKVFIQSKDGKERTAYELEVWSNDYNPHLNSKLGSRNHYSLYLAWQIQTGKKTWKQLCDEKDMSEAFRELKDDDGTFFSAGGCRYSPYLYPESDVSKDHYTDGRLVNHVAFVVLS
ncbi:MAG: hypothetical protein LBL91_02725 [Lachnospiraceae bacterium]|jgi:hypothetical protein|nr:hypothetical protein [Lachnospiraceae bacterium]